jgi:psiF repeat
MKKLLAFTCLSLALAASAPAFAGTQQDKMKSCNVTAKEQALKGDERKAFMKTCLSKEGGAAPAATDKRAAQQDKMKTCNATAKEKTLKGDDRKKFMSDCLKA